MTNILVVDDQIIIRNYFEDILKEEADFQIIASISCADDAIGVCRSKRVDLILMDIKTARNASGITAAKEIKEYDSAIKIVMVTSIVDREVLQKSRTAGADSLWFKEAGKSQLLSVVRRTLAGEKVYPDSSPTVEIGTAKSCEFTSREMDVLRLLVKGYRNPQIAEELGLGTETVKSHINNMLQKTNCKNKLQLVVAVTDAQLIIPKF